MTPTVVIPSEATDRKWSASSDASQESFPVFEHTPYSSTDSLALEDSYKNPQDSRIHSPSASSGTAHAQQWQPRRDQHLTWTNGSISVAGPRGSHGRRKSLIDALHTIRTRKGSVSQNAHDVAVALKAPLSIKLTVCYTLQIVASSDDTHSFTRFFASYGISALP